MGLKKKKKKSLKKIHFAVKEVPNLALILETAAAIISPTTVKKRDVWTRVKGEA